MLHIRVRRPLLLAAAVVAAAFFTSACSDAAGPRGTEEEEEVPTTLVAGTAEDLAAARRRWEAARITRYRFTEGRSCFCISTRPVRLEVARAAAPPHHETVLSIAYDDDGLAGAVEWAEYYLTVEQLFAVIQSSLDNDVEILVSYHPVHGYPTMVDVEPSQHPVDGGVLYKVSRLQVLQSQ